MTDFDGLLKDFSELMDKPLEEQIKVALTGMFTSMQEKYKEDGIDKMILRNGKGTYISGFTYG